MLGLDARLVRTHCAKLTEIIRKLRLLGSLRPTQKIVIGSWSIQAYAKESISEEILGFGDLVRALRSNEHARLRKWLKVEFQDEK